jgi:hypothetical protein
MSESNRIAGGYRGVTILVLRYATYLSALCIHQAALHNPNASAEAKEHSLRVIEVQGSGAVHKA